MANPPASVIPMGPPPVPDASLAVKPQPEWKQNLSMHLICKECKEDPPNLVEDFSAGDTVCGTCGLVLGDRIVDTRSEWRTFTNDDQNNDDPSRVGDGANPLLNGAQLQTTIAFSGVGSSKARDLSRAQNRATHDKATKVLMAAYKEIGAMCDGLKIPKNVADVAKHLFKITQDEGAFRGKSELTVIAGCIFIACRQCKAPRTFREVFQITKVAKPEIGRIFKQLEKLFAERNAKMKQSAIESGGVPVENGTGFENVESTTPKDLCTRFCNTLNLSQKCTVMSQDIASATEAIGVLAGRSPISTAAACIYMASNLSGEARSAKDISQAAGVSDGTIRNAYKIMYQRKEELVKSEWIASGRADFKKLPFEGR